MGADGLPTLVWNKGIAARCDRRIPDEFPDGRTYVPVPTHAGGNVTTDHAALIDEPEQHADIGGGELVWVRGSWLAAFVAQVLPHIRDDFVLVTGDSDSSMPSSAPAVAASLFGCPHLVHWYTQNHDGTGPSDRISALPIGLDLHSVSEHPIWGEDVATPAAQEAQLLAIARALPSLTDRDPRVYLDAWSNHTSSPPLGATLLEPRNLVAAKLHSRAQVVVDPQQRRSAMWRRRGQHAFSASPHGAGLDTHRTWEGLVLGQIVVVPTSSIDPLFDGLRVVSIASWDELTEANLNRWLAEMADVPHPSAALTSDHWIERMRPAVTSSPA
jgi:hypothetical protein